MAYPEDLDSKYNLKDANINFAQGDSDIMPFDDDLFKQGYRNANESATDSVPDAHNVNWIYDILYRNLRYTKDTAIENKNLIANKKATTTSLGQIKVGQGLKVLSDGTLTLENPISGDKQSITYDIPVGMFMLWGGKGDENNLPEGFIEPTGQTITKTEYPELFEWAKTYHSNGTTFSGYFSGTVSNNQCTLLDMRGKFIKIAYNSEVGASESDGIPTLTIASSNHTHSSSSITVANSVSHSHSASVSIRIRGTIGVVPGGTPSAPFYKDGTGGKVHNTSGDPDPIVKMDTNKGGTSASASIGNGGVHSHTVSISSSGGHTHTLTYPSGLIQRNDTRVVPANYGFKLILKAKPSQPQRTVPIGTILDYTGKSAPYGFLIANGITCLKSQFQDLYDWAVLNDVVKPYTQYQEGLPHACYFEGPTSAEFIIPNLSGVYKRNKDKDNSNENVGDYEPDSAPDIEGFFYADTTPDLDNSVYTFSTGDENKRGFVTNTLAQPTKITFNASGANACYGRKNVIQPKTVITLPILKW